MNHRLYQALKNHWNKDVRWFGIKESELEGICEELDKSGEFLINNPDSCNFDFYEACKELGLLTNSIQPPYLE